MGRLPILAKYGSKLVLEVLPSIAATVIGGYLLTQLHLSSTANAPAPAPQSATAPASEQPTVREDRAAMREVLKARRENSEPPATVKPRPEPQSESAAPASALPAAADAPAANSEPAEHAAPVRAAVAAPARPEPPRARPESPRAETARPETARPEIARPEAASVYVPAPPPGFPRAPVASPIERAPPTQIAPVVASVAPANSSVAAALPAPVGVPPASAPGQIAVPPQAVLPAPNPIPAPNALPDPAASADAQVERPRGPVGTVLSTLSSFVGRAANATGHTVNWVIDLPGKAIDAGGRAIDAGGRVIGVNPPPPPPGKLNDGDG